LEEGGGRVEGGRGGGGEETESKKKEERKKCCANMTVMMTGQSPWMLSMIRAPCHHGYITTHTTQVEPGSIKTPPVPYLALFIHTSTLPTRDSKTFAFETFRQSAGLLTTNCEMHHTPRNPCSAEVCSSVWALSMSPVFSPTAQLPEHHCVFLSVL
jgi:hypothetical protein